MRIETLLAAAAALAAAGGCRAVTLSEIEERGAIDVRLDANARAFVPTTPQRVKFFVDITNKTSGTVSLARLKIELLAYGEGKPDQVQIRQSWTYRYPKEVFLGAGKRFTIPIVPERGTAATPGAPVGTASELPLEHLPEGSYEIVAVVNGRHASPPYKLQVARPDLRPELRRT
ncbi:MAG: hypothetical protein HY721_31920 [Planctomycetes bacterium]|nr:hypothetical protein [Planctomycetota bacterium]